jgi:hypothetical protein
MLISLLAGINQAFSQRGNVWCFGDSAGINFNTTPPSAFTSAVKSRGSCASISDSLGNLLFYAYTRATVVGNTTRIIDSTNSLMQNGNNIVGEGWYKELLILPPFNNSTEYLLFSIGVNGSSQTGLYYSKVDLSLNGGLGAVTQKNVQLLNNNANDGLTCVKHGNGRDWWIIFREWGIYNNYFYKYLVSPSGISGPFIQSIGAITYINSYLYFFSKNGEKMGSVGYRGLIETYDFDRCSGQFNNYQLIRPDTTAAPVPEFIGGAFSPDGNNLYISSNGSSSDLKLLQLNLLDSNPINTADTIFQSPFPSGCGGFLQLAPNDKIYWSNAWYDGANFNYPYKDTSYNVYNTYLSVINSPDSLGAACDFQPYSFYLGGGRTYYGLPNNPNYDLGPLVGSVCDTLTVGLSEITNYKNNITVYYDAGWQMAFVNAKGLKGKNYTFQLYNLNGQLVLQEQGKLNTEYFTKDLSLVSNASGIYLVRLITEKEVLTTKFVKE